MVVKDSLDFMWSNCLKEKSDLKTVMMGSIKNSKTKYNIQAEYLQCNEAGENVAFKIACKQEGLGVEFKYTTQGAPQQKGQCKQKINHL